MRAWLGLLAIAVVACGKESVDRPQPPEPLVVTKAAPPIEPEGPRLLPLLDPGRAEEAVGDFRQWLTATCARLRTSNLDRSELQRIGLPEADVETLCLAPAKEGRAIASKGRSVIVEGPSGGDGASGPRALFVVGAERKIPKVTMLVVGPSFEALARIAVPHADDAVMLCTKDGRQGLYWGGCGFVGEGAFQSARERIPKPSPNELRTGFSTACGDSGSVTVLAPSLLGDVLEVPLVVEKIRRTRSGNDEADPCPTRRNLAYDRFVIQYRLDRGHFVRMTMIPTAAERALANP